MTLNVKRDVVSKKLGDAVSELCYDKGQRGCKIKSDWRSELMSQSSCFFLNILQSS